jgi:hypothetical protein
VNEYDEWAALCLDPGKPEWLGARRTVDTAPFSWERGPFGIVRPVWCQGKKEPTP